MSADIALINIDVQESFRHARYWREDDLPAFRERQLALLAAARERGVPVVRVLHAEDSGPFAPPTGWVRPMDWLPEHGDVEFVKHVHNAFTDTGLDYWLRSRGIRRLAIAGIRTEQCCETTTRVASDLGYAVNFVSEATLTFPMVHAASGRRYDVAEIRQRTELVLDGRFARIATVETAFD
ncbi:MAG TPA: isochorismatase family protein [Mizugakiibacter sp.]